MWAVDLEIEIVSAGGAASSSQSGIALSAVVASPDECERSTVVVPLAWPVLELVGSVSSGECATDERVCFKRGGVCVCLCVCVFRCTSRIERAYDPSDPFAPYALVSVSDGVASGNVVVWNGTVAHAATSNAAAIDVQVVPVVGADFTLVRPPRCRVADFFGSKQGETEGGGGGGLCFE